MGAMIGGGEVGGGRSQVHYIYGIRVNGGQKQNKALARLDMLCNLLQKVKRGEKKITSKRKKIMCLPASFVQSFGSCF